MLRLFWKMKRKLCPVFQDELKEVAYKALPADLVDKIKVDVAGMKIGDTLRVKDLEIAKNKNIHITTDPKQLSQL